MSNARATGGRRLRTAWYHQKATRWPRATSISCGASWDGDLIATVHGFGYQIAARLSHEGMDVPSPPTWNSLRIRLLCGMLIGIIAFGWRLVWPARLSAEYPRNRADGRAAARYRAPDRRIHPAHRYRPMAPLRHSSLARWRGDPGTETIFQAWHMPSRKADPARPHCAGHAIEARLRGGLWLQPHR